jgi:hypothetical protein
VELNSAKEGEDKNASEMVVARGFATVVRHRSDEERSSVYETLLELEEKAKQVRGAQSCLYLMWIVPYDQHRVCDMIHGLAQRV